MATRKSSIGVAVIGAGMAGKAHAAAYRTAGTVAGPDLPPVDLVSIADLNRPLAEDAARRFGYRRADGDWRALVEADDVDVVSIVVANHLHREIAEALLAAGKHVLCEKPMAPSLADAEAMVTAARAARERGVESAVGFTFRRSPAIAAVAGLVGSGAIGRPVHFNGHYWCDYSCDPRAPMSWRYRGGPGSGALADIGSHLSDLAEFVCGPVVSVTGATLSTQIAERALPVGAVIGHDAAELSDVREPVENDDLAAFTVTFASGAIGTISVSRMAYGHPNALGFELFAERGAATFDLERAGEFGFIDATPVAGHRPQGYRQVLVGPQHPYVGGGLAMDFDGVGHGQNDLFVWQARAWLDQVCGLAGLPAPASFEGALHNLKLLAAVVESARGGGVEVKVENMTKEQLV